MTYARGGSISYETFLLGEGRLGDFPASSRILIREQISVLAADNDGAIFPVALIPSNARFTYQSAYIRASAITGGTDYDLGFYEYDAGADGGIGAVVDIDRLSGPLDFSAGANLYALSAIGNSSLVGNPLWEVLGLSSDPRKQYLLAFTGNTVGTADGSIYIELEYTV